MDIYRQSYLDEFFNLRCAGDVLNAVSPISNFRKEITESFAIIKQLRKFVLSHPNKYNILDLCAGNALTSVLVAHILPVMNINAIDKLPRVRHWEYVRNFQYHKADVFDDLSNFIDENTIIISSHPCKLARRITEIYNQSVAHALIMIPCCNGGLKRKYPSLFKEKLGAYLRWCLDLCLDVDGQMIIDKKCLSPKNCVVVAEKKTITRPFSFIFPFDHLPNYKSPVKLKLSVEPIILD